MSSALTFTGWLDDLVWGLVFTVFAICNAFDGYSPFWTTWFSLCALFNFWQCWKHRPRGKGRKAAKLIGAKARAIRDKLVAAMPKTLPKLAPNPSLTPGHTSVKLSSW